MVGIELGQRMCPRPNRFVRASSVELSTHRRQLESWVMHRAQQLRDVVRRVAEEDWRAGNET